MTGCAFKRFIDLSFSFFFFFFFSNNKITQLPRF